MDTQEIEESPILMKVLLFFKNVDKGNGNIRREWTDEPDKCQIIINHL